MCTELPHSRRTGEELAQAREIFFGCPVMPLGISHSKCHYLDRFGRLHVVDNHSLDKIRLVFSGDVALLAAAFPIFDHEGRPRANRFDPMAAACAMVRASAEVGDFVPEKWAGAST